MSYIKAENILPQEILTLIQEYADGLYIYIPKKETHHKSWGDNTNSKQITRNRDYEIYCKHMQGTSKSQLAEEYYLSHKSIQRIILNEKRNNEE